MAENNSLENAVTKKKRFPIWAIIAAAVVLVAIIATGIVVARSSITKKRVAEKLELARKYVSELNYEQAIIAYKAAIRIDPKNADLYIELAETYVEAGMDEEAIDLLKKARDKVRNKDQDRIKNKLKKVKNGESDESFLSKLLGGTQGDDAAGQSNDINGNAGETGNGAGGNNGTPGADAGEAFLESMEYDKALEVYEDAVEDDSKDVEALLGIVEVYIRQRDYETALAKAQEYYDLTGDSRFLEKIEMLQRGDVSDSRGRRLKSTYYDASGNIVFWHEFTYDLNGRQTGVTDYNPDGTENSHVDLSHDENMDVNYWWSNTDGAVGKLEHIKENGRTVQARHYDLNGEINFYEEYFYDENGRLSYRLTYDAANGNRLTRKEESFYDDAGREIKMNFYYADETGELKLQSYQTREYDEYGNLTKYSGYSSDGRLEWYDLYETDEEGSRVEYKYNGNGELQGVWK
ncbi:MAG: tetratricopeptide repeat protein [Lachnospiraceae bacterium]|nr:tetratricopeptide repeat protein [Lachnospiraceae bacterium]